MAMAEMWRIAPELQAKFDEQFYNLKPINGLITGDQAKTLFIQSGLPHHLLAQIWSLADMNSDGKIDRHEFGVALFLIQMKIKGFEIPKVLPPSLATPPVQMQGFGGPPLAAQALGMMQQRPVMPNGSPLMGQQLIGPPPGIVSSPQLIRPGSPAPVEAKVQRSSSITSQDSPTAGLPPGLTEWAIPQPSKLKYTQYFNSLDRTRTGFLTGVQARSILIQSGLPQNILAQIWNLADIDTDGRLGSEEFVLAMHLTDCVKAGDILPNALPLDLYPPSYRQGRGRSASIASTGSASMNLLGDLGGVGELSKEEEARQRALMNTFEDKRRENFEKGQAELERRRQMLLESQRKDQEERERKEREEMEKREMIRLEQERRRQLELEKQLAKQRELEQEKEEQRRKVLEQREAARREMDRQRQLEWERQRLQELNSQKQREQEAVGSLKKRSKSLVLELEQLNNRINDLNQHIGETRQGVKELKASIDEMRTRRDTKMAELNNMKMQIRELNDRLVKISQEKTSLMSQVTPQVLNNPTGDSYNSVVYSFNNKQIILNTLRNTLLNIEKETTQKLQDVENNNSQLQQLKDALSELIKNHETLYNEYEQKRQQIQSLKSQTESTKAPIVPSGWDEIPPQSLDVWGNDSNEPTTPSASSIPLASENQETKFIRYRILYAFEARNPDELSIMPGDIVMVPENQSTEPGWLGGELHRKVGWFPESYAERIDSSTNEVPQNNSFSVVSSSTDAAETVLIVGTEMKRTLEGISEAPENGSDVGSFTEEAQAEILQPSENSSFTHLSKSTPSEAASPVPGQGTAAPEGLQAVAMFPWKAKKDNHLTFNKGDVIDIQEQQDMWWFGKLDGVSGWFPKSYVKLISGNGRRDSETNFGVEPTEIVETEIAKPAVGAYYVASYAYQSQESGDLCFQQGDMIFVSKKEGDWWTGTLGNTTGIFPSNYVRVVEPEVVPSIIPVVENPPQDKAVNEEVEKEVEVKMEQTEFPPLGSLSENTKTLKKPEIVTVIAPYKATGAEQLNLERGQLIQVRKKSPSGWWEGETQVKGKKRQVGWFPASYVKPLGGSGQSSARSTPDVMTQIQRQMEEVNGIPESVVAIYGFMAQNQDELTFQKGQVIQLVSKEDPAWWKGELDGAVGLFPANYVVPLDKTSSATPGQWSGDITVFNNLSSNDKKRQGHIDELLSTEEAYNSDMSFVLEVFHKPIKESGLMTIEELKSIFVNWKELLVCNNKLLKALRVRKKMSQNGVIEMIGDILCENIPHMTAYVRFCSCQLRAATLIQQKTENVKEFKILAKQCCRDPRTKGMPLSSFLIKPMQRITKYPLMIKKILEFTDKDHPDYNNLEDALAFSERLCSQVNEGVREKENSERLEWIQSHVHCDNLAEEITFNSLTNCLGSRKLLHSGTLYKAKSNKELMGFLFNDFLLLAQPMKDVGRVTNVFTSDKAISAHYKMYKQPVFLNTILMQSPDPPDETAFQINQVEKNLLLKAVNSNERILWVKKMNTAAKEYIESEKQNFTRQHSIRRRLPIGKLRIVVLEASELTTTKGRCDPYCEVTMGSQEHRTKVVPNSENPKWHASMQFLVKDLQQDVLCISVFDRDLFSPNNFLGRTELRIADIMNETVRTKGPITKRLLLYEVDTGEVELKIDLQIFEPDNS